MAQHADTWRSMAIAVLRKGGYAAPEDIDGSLGTTTYDGIRIAPLYTADDAAFTWERPGEAPFTRGGVAAGTPWEVRQPHLDPDADRCAEEVGRDVAGGVGSVWLRIADAAISPKALPTILERLDLSRVGVVLDAGPDVDAAFAGLMTAAELAAVPPDALTGNLGLDPLGARLRTEQPAELDSLAGYARRCANTMPGLRAVTADATVYHDAGASDAEELGCALAAGVAYLRAMTAAGLDVAVALQQLEFRYAATTDQFLTIAKLRAARRLWTRVAELCGAPPTAQRQHAVTSSTMMAARDPWTNLLRTTVAAFGAVIGGADAVTVQPFDVRLGVPDSHARRIARNTHAVLRDEAHLHRVADPAGGSWFVEHLTEQLAGHAWDWFTEIEALGGMAAAIDSGRVAERLTATWRRRVANAATRRDPITGVSAFPDLDESIPDRDPLPGTAGGPERRPAALFEELRDRTDAHTRRTGTRPSVLLVAVGPASRHTPYLNFAVGLFAVAGLATEVVAAESLGGRTAAVVCVCGDGAREIDGAVRVWRAGGDTAVSGRLYEGCDVLDVLRTTLDDLKVTP